MTSRKTHRTGKTVGKTRRYRTPSGKVVSVVQVRTAAGGHALRATFEDGWTKSFPLGTGRVDPVFAADFAVLARDRGEPSE
jgi:hypothetical protein